MDQKFAVDQDKEENEATINSLRIKIHQKLPCNSLGVPGELVNCVLPLLIVCLLVKELRMTQ